MKRLLAFLFVLLLAFPAGAQTLLDVHLPSSPPATAPAGAPTAQAALAGTDGPVATNFAMFSLLYDALFAPFKSSVAGVSGNLSQMAVSWVKIGIVFMMLVFCVAFALNTESGLFDKLLTRVLIPGTIALFILQGHYDEFVMQVASRFSEEVGSAIVGGVGGMRVSGGAPFDKIFNLAFGAGVVAFKALPLSWMGLALAFVIAIYWLAAAASVGFAFVMFITSMVGLLLLLSIGPVFIALGAFQFSRFLLKGWVSAVCSLICAEILVLALLAIAFGVENTVLVPITQTVGSADVFGVMQSIVGAAVLLFACAVLALKIPAYAVGICGGIFDGIGPWVAGTAAAYNRVPSPSGSGATQRQGSGAQRPSGVAGRNLSGA